MIEFRDTIMPGTTTPIQPQEHRVLTVRALEIVKGISETRHCEEELLVSKPSGKEKPKKAADVQINRDWCKGCGICVAFCPKEVLELDEFEKAVVERLEDCNACGLCELRCPDMAIDVTTT
jgi:2-oxoglutarate ferredoxin oxidoreductase subunit delta